MSATKEHYHDEIEAEQRSVKLIKERPILFSTPMVKAILEGKKTQTRRIVKNNPRIASTLEKTCDYFSKNKTLRESYCPYGKPGDMLWVREKFAKTMGEFEPEVCYSFFADDFHWSWEPADTSNGKTACQWHDPDLSKEVKWKPSIHMPKEAARIWLQVEEIKVELLLSISMEDAKSEGIEKRGDFWKNYNDNTFSKLNPCASFSSLWVKINGTELWNSNPWVWVVKFKVLSTVGKPSFDSPEESGQATQDDKLSKSINK